jgi:hypothetical protein
MDFAQANESGERGALARLNRAITALLLIALGGLAGGQDEARMGWL